MVYRITQKDLDDLGGASTLDNIRRIRGILTRAGVTDIELHPLEIRRVIELRESERLAREGIGRLLAGGPMPVCTCTLDRGGIIESSSGCPLQHRVGEFPDPVA